MDIVRILPGEPQWQSQPTKDQRKDHQSHQSKIKETLLLKKQRMVERKNNGVYYWS